MYAVRINDDHRLHFYIEVGIVAQMARTYCTVGCIIQFWVKSSTVQWCFRLKCWPGQQNLSSYWNFLSIEDFMFDWRRHEKFQSSIGHFHTLKLVHNFTKQFSPSDLSVLFMLTVVRNVYRSNLHQYFLRLQKFSQERKYG